VANVRARLAAARGDLEAARAFLLELIELAPDDADAPAALARVAVALRKVLALDAAWRDLGTPRAQLSRGESAPGGPLKLGPSANRAAAGAPGHRTGASEEGSGGNRLDSAENATSLGSGGLSEEDASALLDRLRQIHAERRAYDERRSDAAAARSPRRS
jgi:hypothetical protein